MKWKVKRDISISKNPALKDLKELEHLFIQNNRITTFKGLKLKKITGITCSDNALNIKAFNELKGVEVFYFSCGGNCKITEKQIRKILYMPNKNSWVAV